ncbi:UDP-N-acetylglucosamine transferase subunit [Coemansia guatemalensis]|uniref:UDP-N-acetylglucosamine transferase subunit ALG14 n=1 Tax=Coemansia guatemalensis TaxID=2761395 RepID=A0A9W8LQE3_9FUNG|nr:UDP-N-acetylglucosamine transferase subunit [Coemansia guatemalensis]
MIQLPSLSAVAAFIAAALLVRLYFVLPMFGRSSRALSSRRKGKAVARAQANKMLCVVLGSGGHTAEMMRLLQGVDFSRYTRRLYVVSDCDVLSLDQIGLVEGGRSIQNEEYYVGRVPRSRKVGQSWKSTPASFARCLLSVTSLLYNHRPDAILCNGPANCVVVGAVAMLLRIIGIKHIPVIYVESFARVHSLSLSGRILYLLADRFVVQWPGLVRKYPRAEYIPHLV